MDIDTFLGLENGEYKTMEGTAETKCPFCLKKATITWKFTVALPITHVFPIVTIGVELHCKNCGAFVRCEGSSHENKGNAIIAKIKR
ncbi:MAG: hypothetical protein J7L07_02805 [Candidatus Odinarchaeota archaeon]|nr:hypothetical protein [Candidatus Odinarchaeota archaeon]